jgi:hypothetical protein
VLARRSRRRISIEVACQNAQETTQARSGSMPPKIIAPFRVDYGAQAPRLFRGG